MNTSHPLCTDLTRTVGSEKPGSCQPRKKLTDKSSNLPNMPSPCQDCPFRKDSLPGWLGSSRMGDYLSKGSFVCHKKHDLQCAGHMLIRGEENTFVQMAGRLGIPLVLTGRELVFDTQAECIAHHDNTELDGMPLSSNTDREASFHLNPTTSALWKVAFTRGCRNSDQQRGMK